MVGTLSFSAFPASDPETMDELRSRLIRISTEAEIDFDVALVTRELETRTLLDQLPDFIYVKDRRSRFVFANAAANRNSKYHNGIDLIGKTDFDILDHETARELFAIEQEIMSGGAPVVGREERIKLSHGGTLWLMTSKIPLRNDTGQIVGLVGISRDITDRKRQDDRRHGHARLLEMIARGQPLQTVLDALVRTVEEELDDVTASVLLFDETSGCLRHGASFGLPQAYLRLCDGFEIGPKRASCGTAAWRRSAVIVKNVSEDPLWEDFRELARFFALVDANSWPRWSAARYVCTLCAGRA
jgi:PAS domain S-box-containing protein